MYNIDESNRNTAAAMNRIFLFAQLLLLPSTVSSFAPFRVQGQSRPHLHFLMSSSENTDLIRFTTPSQSEADSLGIREWPQQAKSKGTFEELVQEGQTLVRYILDGEARVIVVKKKNNAQKQEIFAMRPGCLLEVRGEAKLSWQVESEEVILLTPGFEQLGLFAGVVIGLIMVTGALIASN